MYEKYKELIEACRKGYMYDFIASKAYQFDKAELVEILKQTYYAIYERLNDQNKEVEQLIPWLLMDYGFFGEDLTFDETAYIEYLDGQIRYDDYLNICKRENVEPRQAK